MRAVSSWGRLDAEQHEWLPLTDRRHVAAAMHGARGIAHGNGRSYGDVALNPGGPLWATRGLDRFIGFDATAGIVECEAGALLGEISTVTLPRGWFLPVTPGTQFVTVGGAIANDVHGKNHHLMGTFGDHVERLELQRTDGRRITCGPGLEEPWFRATVGGLGLTGVITSARLRLRRVPGPWIESQTLLFSSLSEFIEISRNAVASHEYTVAWIDCLATRGDALRGVLFSGRHVDNDAAAPRAKPHRVAFVPPCSLVNGASLAVFNRLYHFLQRRRSGRPRLQVLDAFFYPLDALIDWNRIYGPRGFYQYQCVVPQATQLEATHELLNLIARDGSGSFLGVLKTFAERPAAGMLSFPRGGITLALDFPNRGRASERLFERLDDVVVRAGGRLYAAKDARMPRTVFEAGYPRLAEFVAFRDPGMSSRLSRRLLGD